MNASIKKKTKVKGSPPMKGTQLTIRKRLSAKKKLTEFAEDFLGIDLQVNVTNRTPRTFRHNSNSGVHKTCDKFGIEFIKNPYADSDYFDDYYNIFNFHRTFKNNMSDIAIPIHMAARELKATCSHQKQMDIVTNLNMKLISMIDK